MHRLLIALALPLLSALPVRAQTTYQWNTTTTPSSWATAANWLPNTGTPGMNDTAAFINLDITANATVTLDANQSVNKMIFGDINTSSSGGWIVSAGLVTTATLTVAGANPTIAVNALGGGIVNLTAPVLATNLTIAGPGVFNLGNLPGSVISGIIITNDGTFEFGSGFSPGFGTLTFSGNGTFSSGLSATYSVFLSGITNAAGATSTISVGGRAQLGTTNAPSDIAGSLTIKVGAQVAPPARVYVAGTWENTSGSPAMLNLVGTTTTSYISPTFNGPGNNAHFNSLLTNVTFNLSSSTAGVNKIYINPHNNSGGNIFNMGALGGTGDSILTSDNTGAGTTYSVGMLGTSTTFGGTFTGNCSLTKVGSGTLTLTNNSAVGLNAGNAVNVNAGKLVGVTGGSFIAPSFNVAAGAANAVQIAATNGVWTTTNLVYASGAYLEFNFGSVSPSTTVAPLLTSNLSLSGTLNLSVIGNTIAPGTYPLIKYNTFSGTAPITALSLPPATYGVISNDIVTTRTIYLVVTPLLLVTSGADDGSAGTLRSAIANAIPGTTITFTNTLSGATILLASGELLLTNNLTIDASTLTNGISLDGNHAGRIFNVPYGVVVTLDSLTLTNGYCGQDEGGAIFNLGSLNVNRCTIVGNSTDHGFPDDGGGIYNEGSSLTLANSTFYNNSAWEGGAVRSTNATLLVTNCTFAANNAGVGGACSSANLGPTSVFNQVTVVGNNSDDTNGNSGGLFFYDQQVTIINCIVAANTNVYGYESDVVVYNFPGDLVSFVGSNLVEVVYFYGDPNDLIGTETLYYSPANLAPLGNYGGPTPTMPPLPGSPAIGSAVGPTPTTDQRGYPRGHGSLANIGAVEGVFDDAISLGNPTPVPVNGILSSLQFGFTNLSGAPFTVLASTNVAWPNTNWIALGKPTESPVLSGQYLFMDANVTNYTQRFYRVSWP